MQRVTNRIEQSRPAAPSRVRVASGPDAGTEFALPAVGIVLGAGPGCDVVLRDSAVSRRHASVVATSSGFDVTDLGSRNGTWVDGVAIARATLPPGSTVCVGRTSIQLLPSEEDVVIAPSEATSFGAMVGASAVIRRVYALLERAAAAASPVVLLGESGTGKELAARGVHDRSARASGPFVVFDCGAASESLVEGQLFGHKRGAFTGAHADRPGAFAQAHRGTLFLDEIGELPLALQPKLLRLLERGEVTPLGSHRVERYDVRVIAATHRDLLAEVARGAFRADLYYRLAVIEVHLPALRQRRDDIAILVRAFLASHGRSAEGVTGAALERLQRYAWPGNVRELRNVIARAVALAPPEASFEELPLLLRPAEPSEPNVAVSADVPFHDAKAAIVKRFEVEYLADLMRRADGNVSHAARLANVERKHLYRLLEKAGLLPARARATHG